MTGYRRFSTAQDGPLSSAYARHFRHVHGFRSAIPGHRVASRLDLSIFPVVWSSRSVPLLALVALVTLETAWRVSCDVVRPMNSLARSGFCPFVRLSVWCPLAVSLPPISLLTKRFVESFHRSSRAIEIDPRPSCEPGRAVLRASSMLISCRHIHIMNASPETTRPQTPVFSAIGTYFRNLSRCVWTGAKPIPLSS